MEIVHSSKFNADNRVVLVRRNVDTRRYFWAHPDDGSPHGTLTTAYAEFKSKKEAVSEAKRLGYSVVTD
jgi:hypothetical protein